MTATTGGQYRVLRVGPATSELLVLDRSSFEPVEIEVESGGPVPRERQEGLRPGYLIDATLSWTDGTARLGSLDVIEPTLFAFADGVTNLFEVALDTWSEARAEGSGINSTITYSNDGAPNGALYTFAQQPGERDIFAEFQDGRRPLEPLLDRIDEEPPYEVFVFRPATHEFVLVYVVLAKGSMLADTVRDTYDCPRPSEPLLENSVNS
ncbi:MAG: DUF6663 family protein [Halobacteriaceae archaeon]